MTGVDRRDFLKFACLCSCGGFGATTATPAFADPDGPQRGCNPRPQHIARLKADKAAFSTVGEFRTALAERPELLRTTGNPGLDRALDRALQRLADTFAVQPAFGFDRLEPNNAWATDDNSFVRGTDGTVGFGTAYFTKWLNYDPSGIAVIGTCAHEFGHIWMFKSGHYERLNAGRGNVKRTELHADFMAGYYLGLRKRDNPDASFWKAGDKFRLIGDTSFGSPNHHGTPEERLAAAEAGFRAGYVRNEKAPAAFQQGLDYVVRT